MPSRRCGWSTAISRKERRRRGLVPLQRPGPRGMPDRLLGKRVMRGFCRAFCFYLANWRRVSARLVRWHRGWQSSRIRSPAAKPATKTWYIAELLRLRGELILLEGAADAAVVAEQHFRARLRLGAPPGCSLLGAANGDESRATLARSASRRGGARCWDRSTVALPKALGQQTCKWLRACYSNLA